MFRIKLDYTFTAGTVPHLDNALFTLLRAIRDSGSISQSAAALGFSYRHVWGELKRWEGVLGHALLEWIKGRRARLSPFGEKLLWAEERARARVHPQAQSLAAELERAFSVVFDDSVHVLPVCASHDLALPLLRDALVPQGVHLDLRYAGSLDALRELTAGRALLAGFHVNEDHPKDSLTARTFKRALTPGRHKLIDFALRHQGLMAAPGNPLGINGLRDLTRKGVRFINRQHGSGTRIELDQLLAAAKIDTARIKGFDTEESTHLAVAAAVAAGAADCGFGIEAAAEAYGLAFVPLALERYYLVCLKETLDHPALRVVIACLQASAWRERISSLPGYQIDTPGRILSLTRALPWYRYRSARPI